MYWVKTGSKGRPSLEQGLDLRLSKDAKVDVRSNDQMSGFLAGSVAPLLILNQPGHEYLGFSQKLGVDHSAEIHADGVDRDHLHFGIDREDGQPIHTISQSQCATF